MEAPGQPGYLLHFVAINSGVATIMAIDWAGPGIVRAALELIWPASESSSRAARKDGGLFPTPMKVGQNHTTLIQFEAGNNPPLNNMRRTLTYSDPKS